MQSNLMRAGAAMALCLGAAACTTAAAPKAGFLTSYDRLEAREDTVRAKVAEVRDDAAASQVEQLFIEAAVLTPGVGEGLSGGERAFVLREVERQVCYELSERFTVVDRDGDGVARVRLAVTRIGATGRVGSVVSAAANQLIPGPIGVRPPGSTGGLSAEAELVSADGRIQIAAIVYSRDAQIVGTDNPSLSRIGDAVQFAEPFGDMVGDTFAPKDRKPRKISDPDPCARYGPRLRPEGVVSRFVTGLYQPELSGGVAEEPKASERPR